MYSSNQYIQFEYYTKPNRKWRNACNYRNRPLYIVHTLWTTVIIIFANMIPANYCMFNFITFIGPFVISYRLYFMWYINKITNSFLFPFPFHSNLCLWQSNCLLAFIQTRTRIFLLINCFINNEEHCYQ